MKFKRYKMYKSVRTDNSARRGSAIIVKNNVHHHEHILQSEEMQISAVNIKLTKNINITAASYYNPPNHSVKKPEYIELFTRLSKRFILGGNFNAKHTHCDQR